MTTALHTIWVFVIMFGLQFTIAENLSLSEWAITVAAICVSYISGLVRGAKS